MPLAARRRRASLVAPLVLAALAIPAAAQAATVTVSGSNLTFNAGSGEPNALRISKSGGFFRVVDTGATAVTANAGCTQVSPRIASCAVAAVTTVNAYLWDQDDSAIFTGDSIAKLYGYKGSDDLTGGSGNDVLDAGAGSKDRLSGRGGNDVLTAAGATGPTFLFGGDGNDTLTGATTAGQYTGTLGTFDGGAGTDKISGSEGDDALVGGPGADTMDGKGGFDIAVYGERSEAITVNPMDGLANDGGPTDGPAGSRDKVSSNVEGSVGGSGNDVLTGTPSRDTLLGGDGDDTLNGGSGDDTICGDGLVGADSRGASYPNCSGSGTGGNDTLNGAAGNDALTGNLGADVLNGGTGVDAASYSERGNTVVATINDCPKPAAPCAQANDGALDADVFTDGDQPEGDKIALDVESLSGGQGDDMLSGSDGDNQLDGSLGNDTLVGLDGDDVLCGDRYDFSRFGSSSGYAPDVCYQFILSSFSPVADSLDGGAGDDLLNGNQGADVLNGGVGRDTVSYSSGSAFTSAFTTSGVDASIDDTCVPPDPNPCALANDGARDTDPATPGEQGEGDTIARDVENLIGTNLNDTLTGSATVNTLTGGDGTDTLNGLAAGDVLEPGGGSGDVVNGGGGTDYASYRVVETNCQFCFGGVTVSLDGVANDGSNSGAEGDNIKTDVEGVLGTDLPDVLTGQGGSTANVLLGYGGEDQITGNGGNDSLNGGSEADTLSGGTGDDVLDSADGGSDTSDCGDGTGDRAVYDIDLDAPANCETLDGESGAGAFASAKAAQQLVTAQHAYIGKVAVR